MHDLWAKPPQTEQGVGSMATSSPQQETNELLQDWFSVDRLDQAIEQAQHDLEDLEKRKGVTLKEVATWKNAEVRKQAEKLIEKDHDKERKALTKHLDTLERQKAK